MDSRDLSKRNIETDYNTLAKILGGTLLGSCEPLLASFLTWQRRGVRTALGIRQVEEKNMGL
jgi:hypothetical protein